MDLDYFKLLKLTYDEVTNDDILRELNHKRQIETEDIFHDPLRDRLLSTEPACTSPPTQPGSKSSSEPSPESSGPENPAVSNIKVEEKANEPETVADPVATDTVQAKADDQDSESDLEDWLDSVI